MGIAIFKDLGPKSLALMRHADLFLEKKTLMRRKFINSHLPRFFCAVLLASSLCGCIATRIAEWGKIKESFEPKSVLVGNDGAIAIEFEATHYREKFRSRAYSKAPEDHNPISSLSPRRRYVVVRRAYIEKEARNVVEGLKSRYMQEHDDKTSVTLAAGAFGVNLNSFYPHTQTLEADYYLIPGEFMAPDAKPEDLPASLRPDAAERHALDETITTRWEDNTLLIHLDKVRLESNREEQTWRGRLAYPVGIVEIPIEFVGMFVLNLITLPFRLLALFM